MANEKILNTRVLLKYDTLANWNASTFIPKKGEMCIATVDTAQKDAKGNIVTVPTLLIKVGSGAEGATFSTLPFVSAPAADVYDWAKQSEADFVSNFLKLEGMQALLDGVFATDAELATAIAGVQSQIDALAGRMTTAEGKITTLEDDLAAHKEEFIGYKNDMANIHDMSAQVDAKLMDDIHAVENDLAAHKEEFIGYKNDMANIHNMSAEVDAKLMDDISAVEDDLAAFKDEFTGYKNDMANVHNMQAQVDAKLMDDIHAIEDDLAAHKENVANIHNMQAQNDAALLTKIQKNREDIAANKEAQDAVNAGIEAHFEEVEATIAANKNAQDEVNAAQAETNATLADGIAKNAADLVAHKNDMATIHDLQGQIDAELSLRIKTNKQNIAAEVERATAAEKANADEIARVDNVLKAAIENDGEGIDSIKELATWVEEHGKDAADIIKAVEDEAKARADADAELATDIADFKAEFVGYKDDMANVHNMQAQVDAKLMDDIHTVEDDLASEVAAREALEATALQTVSTGVGLKATKTGTDAKVEIDDSVVFVFDCGSATTNID